MSVVRNLSFFQIHHNFIVLTIVVIGIVAYVPLAGSVSKQLSNDDIVAIQSLGVEKVCSDISTFEKQVACIKSVQSAIKERFPNQLCPPVGTRIEPMDFLERGYGCCYDRARFIGKALIYYNMTTRHVALYDKTNFGLLAFLVPHVQSHATNEVFTKKGWMGIGALDRYVLMTKDGRPLTFKDLATIPLDSLREKPNLRKSILVKPFLVIYGLYSRHGMFHGNNLPAPEINYPDFIKYNFMSE